MCVILVDFENIHALGLKGIDLLNSADELQIFYSTHCSTIKKEYIDIIEKVGCSLKLIKLYTEGPSFLDRYICVRVGELRQKGETQIAIVAKDSGYQSVIQFYTDVMDVDRDFRIVKADSIEQALICFSDVSNRERRRIAHDRAKLISLDDLSARLKEREAIRAKIKAALIDTPYSYKVQDVCGLHDEKQEGGRRAIYTGAMHSFGREEGRAIYSIIKEVV